MEKKIAIAYVNKPVGVKGEMKVTILLDDPKILTKIPFLFLKNSDTPIKVERVFKIVGDTAAVKLEGFDNPESAIKLKSCELFAEREVLESLIESDKIFIADLINKIAVAGGEELGKIVDVENYGANDIVFIDSKKYKNLSFANIGGIIEKIDHEKNIVILNKEKFWQVAVFDKDGEKDED